MWRSSTLLPRKLTLTAGGVIVLLLALVIGAGPQPAAAAIPVQTQPLDRSMAFGGSDDYVSISDDPQLRLSGGSLTIEAWIRGDDMSGCETFVSKGFNASSYWFGHCGGVLRFWSNGSAVDAATTIPPNVWTHVAVTLSGGQLRYYINGRQDDVDTGVGTPAAGNTKPVTIGADPDVFNLLGSPTRYEFDGLISGVRLWSSARSRDEIRRLMHVALDEPRPGLIASWWLAGDARDRINGFDGTINGIFYDDTAPPPIQPDYPLVNLDFDASWGFKRARAPHAYLPATDEWLLIGGQQDFASIARDIRRFDPQTARTRFLANLDGPLFDAPAVYAPATDRVYTFGGRNATSGTGSYLNQILAINPADGASTVLSATLPAATSGMTAIYHPPSEKVLLFGGIVPGGGEQGGIHLFDPLTESLVTLPAALPTPAYLMAGAYSPAAGKIYLLGGANGVDRLNTIVVVDLLPDGSDAVVETLPVTLPAGVSGGQAVLDPVSQLIYLIGGSGSSWIQVFDPVTTQAWATRQQLPQQRFGPVVMYSERLRAAYLMGGTTGFGSSPADDLWRFSLGDGPAVSTGRWDFPQPAGSKVTAIDGAEDTVLVGTSAVRAYRYPDTGPRTHYTSGQLGTSAINDVDYDPVTGKRIFATQSNGVKIDHNGSFQTIDGTALGGDAGARSVEYAPQTGQPLIGTHTQGLRRLEDTLLGDIWTEDFANRPIEDIVRQDSTRVWVVINQDGNERLGRLAYSSTFGLEAEYPNSVCSLDYPQALTLGSDGSWWVAGQRVTEFDVDAGICYIPFTSAFTGPVGGTRLTPAIGDEAVDITTDADGRIWAAIEEGVNQTGGIVVYESVEGVTTSELNYLNAPISGRDRIAIGTTRPWESSISAVAAVDERVWFGRPNGDLITAAPRWQQIDEVNDMDSRILQNVWTVRGRLFAATSSTLHVLQPDGQTWENLASGKVWDVMGDRQGRIWVATNTGIRLYTPTGWDFLSDRVGSRPSTATYALAEDLDGRVWIGGLFGLTLFDRDRFVATFDPSSSGLPDDTIRTLFVDDENHLWVGTDVGLVKFDGRDWTTFTTANGLPANAIFDVVQLPDGTLAVSTAAGLSFFDGTSFATQTMPIPANNLPLSVDDRGRLWAGKAAQIGDGEWQVYYATNSGMAATFVSDHAADGAERIWFSHAPAGGLSVRSSYLPPLSDSVPIISNVTPASGKAGDTIVIEGSGFGYSYRDVEVFFGNGRAEIDRLSDDEIRVILRADATSGDVVVKVGERQAAQAGVFCAIPVIDSFTPTGGNAGVVVDVRGTNFDPNAQLSIGSGLPHPVFYRGATHLAFDILPTDPSGALSVQNQCAGDTHKATSTGREFRRIDLVLDEINFNQGINGRPLVADRPTMVSHFLRTIHNGANVVLRTTDVVQLNQIVLNFTEPGGASWSTTLDYSGPVPTWFLPLNDRIRSDASNSVNVSVTPDLDGGTGSPVTVTATLRNRGRVVSSGSTATNFARNQKLRVLMVPIMRNDFSRNDLNALKADVNDELEHIRRRIMPMGDVELYWSPSAIELNQLSFNPDAIDVGDSFRLFDAGHTMDRFRRHWNYNNPSQKVSIAFGVIEGEIVSEDSGASGLAFWPDISAMLNAMGLSSLDVLCDVGDAFIGILTLGAFGGRGCDLEIPLYVAWGQGNTGNSSHLIGHEVGHVLGLVRAYAPNGNISDNHTHSVNDEIDGGECNTIQGMGSTATYNVDKTLYRQPGVQLPIVNPMTTGQWVPRLSVTTTLTFTTPTTYSVTSEAFTMRAKSIMSYACGRGNNQVYFEPADEAYLLAGYRMAPNTSGDLRPDALLQTAAADEPTPLPVAGSRLFVSGVISQTTQAGSLVNVEVLGGSGSLDASYNTGVWLVQRSAGGVELGRTGLFPVFDTTDHDHDDEDGVHDAAAEEKSGFFAATVIVQPGLARLELERDGAVLDSFTAGPAAPTVAITSPAGGSFAAGDIELSWSAGDGDGDPLQIAVSFSPDNGTTWVPIALPPAGTTALKVPVAALVGTSQGRFKVAVSDGLQQAEAISQPFTVANQPPQPYVGSPADGTTVLEGGSLLLTGGAYTNLGDLLPGEALTWSSDRDGPLGGGAALDAVLSVGTHILTLTAADGGLEASAAITVTVLGDYDVDGLPDAEELASGLSLFDANDVRSDADGDGLPWLQERNWGTDPGKADSDGDGRNDGNEIEAGTDPLLDDDPLPADELHVEPESLVFTADLAQRTPDPQAILQVLSREPVGWTVSADRSWIDFSAVAGQTPAAVTVVVDAGSLPNGVHTANVTFNSPLGSESVAVEVTVSNAKAGWNVYMPFLRR